MSGKNSKNNAKKGNLVIPFLRIVTNRKRGKAKKEKQFLTSIMYSAEKHKHHDVIDDMMKGTTSLQNK
jgi:hypothetical protein